jgi:branched-chain amino acid transport system permease protein
MKEITTKNLLFILFFVIMMILLPSFIPSYYMGLVIQIFIMSIFAMSLDILVGYTGLPSMGHATYFGVAGYATGFLYLAGIKNFWYAIVFGIGVGGLTAILFGLLALRAQGPYFMLITMALAQVIWGIAFKWRSLTRGDDGLSGIGRPDVGLGIDLTPDLHFYYFTLAIFSLVFIALFILIKSPFGYTLKGIRESESRMMALGYNVWFYKYLAFIFAGAFAGVSGVLWVFYKGFVGPSSLGIEQSVEGLLMLILGGAGTPFGPAFGAGIIILFEYIVSSLTERWSLIQGIIYVVTVLLFSEGIIFSIVKRSK